MGIYLEYNSLSVYLSNIKLFMKIARERLYIYFGTIPITTFFLLNFLLILWFVLGLIPTANPRFVCVFSLFYGFKLANWFIFLFGFDSIFRIKPD